MQNIRNNIRQNAEGLLSCCVSSHEAEQEILKFHPQLLHFANEYTEFGQRRGASSAHRQLATLESQGTGTITQFIAKSVVAVEESIVSPELGLKGNVDMLVDAWTSTMTTGNTRQSSSSIMGLELKTGHNQKSQNAHLAQIVLYIVMLQTRHGSQVKRGPSGAGAAANSGLLLYMSSASTRAVNVAPMLSEIKSLIGLRNVVAVQSICASRPRGILLSYEDDAEDPSKAKVQ